MIADIREQVLKAGDLLMDYFHRLTSDQISLKYKGGLQTEADTAAEDLLIAGLTQLVPGSGVLAEESGEKPSDAGRWIIDPLDGTSNFAAGIPWFGISVAFEAPGEPGHITHGIVYNPANKELFEATEGKGATLNGERIACSDRSELTGSMLATGFYYHKGQELSRAMGIFQEMQQVALGVRRFGAAALDLAYVAAGRYDGFWEKGLHSWDQAAGALLITEAGGRLSNYRGGHFDVHDRETVASNGHVHANLVNMICKGKNN